MPAAVACCGPSRLGRGIVLPWAPGAPPQARPAVVGETAGRRRRGGGDPGSGSGAHLGMRRQALIHPCNLVPHLIPLRPVPPAGSGHAAGLRARHCRRPVRPADLAVPEPAALPQCPLWAWPGILPGDPAVGQPVTAVTHGRNLGRPPDTRCYSGWRQAVQRPGCGPSHLSAACSCSADIPMRLIRPAGSRPPGLGKTIISAINKLRNILRPAMAPTPRPAVSARSLAVTRPGTAGPGRSAWMRVRACWVPAARQVAWRCYEAAEVRRSWRRSACPDSTPVRICRATASSSATCGLVRE